MPHFVHRSRPHPDNMSSGIRIREIVQQNLPARVAESQFNVGPERRHRVEISYPLACAWPDDTAVPTPADTGGVTDVVSSELRNALAFFGSMSMQMR